MRQVRKLHPQMRDSLAQNSFSGRSTARTSVWGISLAASFSVVEIPFAVSSARSRGGGVARSSSSILLAGRPLGERAGGRAIPGN